MFNREDPQRKLFAADAHYLEYVGKNSFYAFLATERHHLFCDDDFAEFYSEKIGRPSVPPSLLATALLLQAHDKISDAEATDRSRFDLRWKVALGLELEENLYAKSTLQTFRAQLIIHDKFATLFKASLKAARRRGFLGGKRKLKLAVDTTSVLGRGAVMDTYNLLAEGIRKLAIVLARIQKQPIDEWLPNHNLDRYFGSSIKGESDVDWSNKASQRAFLTSLVDDAVALLVITRVLRGSLEVDSADDRALVAASELLRALLMQDVEVHPEGGNRIKEGVAKDRIVSTTDTEMRHGRKSSSHRFDGHKASIAVDAETGVITEVEVIAGNAPDNTGALALVERSEANTGLEVETTIGDCAYGDGKTRQEFVDANRDLAARVPKRPDRDVFPKQDFKIDLSGGTVTCPAGVTTDVYRMVKINDVHVRQYLFPANSCLACALRSQCTKQKSVKSYGRQITLHPQEALLQGARAYQRTEQFKVLGRLRQTVEHRIARLVQLGIRQSRFFGRVKTKFQLMIAATVANLTLIMGVKCPETILNG